MAVPDTLITISLVTRDRPLFLEHALELIAQQDYPANFLEVVLVDDSEPSIEPLLSTWPVCRHLQRLQYHRVPRGMSIGEKRNYAVQHSQGSIIMQWDDDDYYGPNRVTRQTEPIRAGRARCSALLFDRWYFLDQDEFWRGPPPEAGYGLNGGHPGTFTFDRGIWSPIDKRLQYPHTSFADPDDFHSAASELLEAKTEEVGDEIDFVYVRHRNAAASCEGDINLGLEEAVLGIYFEVLGVRSFGTQIAVPDFLPARTRQIWASIRNAPGSIVTVGATDPSSDMADRFDTHCATALDLVLKNLDRFSDEDLVQWFTGKASYDDTKRRAEIRDVFLRECLPAFLNRMANRTYRFQARQLANAVIACARIHFTQLDLGGSGPAIGNSSGKHALNAVQVALSERLEELGEHDRARASWALRSLEGKLSSGEADPGLKSFSVARSISRNYFVVGSWSGGKPEEMKRVSSRDTLCHSSTNFVWSVEVSLSPGVAHTFQVTLGVGGEILWLLGVNAAPRFTWQIPATSRQMEYWIKLELLDADQDNMPRVSWGRVFESVD